MPACRRNVVIALLVACAFSPAAAQFGQNKITYERFDFKTYAAPHFDVYYYPAEEPFLEDVVSLAESAYLKLSKEFDHELRWRVPMIVYQTHEQFEQTNIQLSEIPESTLAFAEPIQNRMVFPIDQPPDFLYALITHELTHIFEFSFFFEGNIGRVVRSNPPLWLMEGLASYMAQDESSIDKMVIRDAVVNNVLPPIQALDIAPFFAYRYGHAIFDFIAQEHGKEGLRNFIFEYRKHLLTNNLQKAVEDAFGYDLDEFNRRFNRYLRKKYFPVLLEKKTPDDYGREIGLKKHGGVFTFSPTLSPSGELVAALATPKMDLDLVVLNAEDGSLVKNVTKGWTNKYRYLTAETFSGKKDLSWSPTNDHVAVFARKENRRILLIYDAIRGKLVRKIDLGDIVQGASPAYSPDGRRIAFEGNRHGVVDIFEYDLDTGNIANLTQDDQFDANPAYAEDGGTLLYNRRIGPYWKIFAVDRSDPTRKTQISFGPSSDIQPSYSRDGKTVYFASDRNEYHVYNIYALNLETGGIAQYTDVTAGTFSPVEMAEHGGEKQLVFTAYFQGTFRLYRMAVRQPEAKLEVAASAGAAPVEPFEPPLQLTVDQSKEEPYKRHWDIEAPYVNVGVADDGTFLTNSAIQFSDLLGDQRIQILASTVSSYSNIQATYLNVAHRANWGATLFDYRDYYFVTDVTNTTQRNQVQRITGVNTFLEYPFSRHYRVQGAVGYYDRSQDQLLQDAFTGQLAVDTFSERFATLSATFVGDTTRFQSFGPFQGKRFSVGVLYGANAGGDLDGDLLEYQLDFRAYKQLTRRSLIAWRLAGVYGAGDLQNYYSLGGINQLRGYDFREFFGSRVVYNNLELRFPLIDELQTPILGFRDIRGFLFFDVGAAWFPNNQFFDPAGCSGPLAGQALCGFRSGFKFWDSENNRLQDGRGSYGFGLQFFFLGGLQFNWAWAKRMDYTQYLFDPNVGDFVPTKAHNGGYDVNFYIVFDY